MCIFEGIRPVLFEIDTDPNALLNLAGEPDYQNLQLGDLIAS